MRLIFEAMEKIVGGGENACYQHFLFPVFSSDSVFQAGDSVKTRKIPSFNDPGAEGF